MKKHIETLCVHPLSEEYQVDSPLVAPIQTATSYIHINRKELTYPGFFSTYNQKRLGTIMAKHEGGAWGIVFNSGMAAIGTAVLSFVHKGDHVIFSKELYGGTVTFASEQLPRMGISCSFAEPSLESYQQLTQKNTRLIFLETPSNPLLTILPLNDIAKWATMNGIITIVDNTLATSINQRPIEAGCDISIQSGTKYLGGHSDIQFGTLVTSKKEMQERILPVAKLYGASLSPEHCYRAERSLKTLSLRVSRQNENAMAVAEFLRSHKSTKRVFYPGLETHLNHAIAMKQMSGFGGIVSFEVKTNGHGIDRFLNRLALVKPALSLGGVESLICVPARTSHSSLSPYKRKRIGIKDNLIRLSVGIEAVEDILLDLKNAME
jgi:cystathionine beta-lyase